MRQPNQHKPVSKIDELAATRVTREQLAEEEKANFQEYIDAIRTLVKTSAGVTVLKRMVRYLRHFDASKPRDQVEYVERQAFSRLYLEMIWPHLNSAERALIEPQPTKGE